ncbi:MAG: PqqD family protein [Calditrichaeota bacterium]|nr:PqqD family protein [Candidatus Cloacimonadota bacterium]MCB1045803.1 PqqD family protein [Calditrichota bacterium]MCB9473441.1 PqqD family protein [Candidatus Delongbacteria bacterium]
MTPHDTLELSDDGFLFDHRRGASYVLNPTGVLLLKWMNQGLSQADVIHRMVETWAIDAQRASRDLAGFVQRLDNQRLLGGREN